MGAFGVDPPGRLKRHVRARENPLCDIEGESLECGKQWSEDLISRVVAMSVGNTCVS